MIHQLLQWDTELFIFLNNFGCKDWDTLWLYITNMFSWIPFYFMLLLIIYHNYGWKKLGVLILVVALMILCTDQIVNIIKHSVQRLRPCQDPLLEGKMWAVGDQCGGRFGFCSGHAANHFALAIFLGKLFYKKYKYAIYLLILWAGIIAYSRIYVGVHYPLDVLCGALLGSVFGILFSKFYIWVKRKIFIG